MSYEMIDHFLRNNLDDEDYAEYSAALDSICATSAPDVVQPLTVLEINDFFEHIKDDKEVLKWSAKDFFAAGVAFAGIEYGIGGSDE